MFLLKQILPAAIMAVLVAAALSSFLFFRPLRRVQNVLEPIAAGIAYLAGHFFVVGAVSFPPKDTTNWLAFFAGVIGVATAFCLSMRRNWIRFLIMSLIFAIALRLLLAPRFHYGWSSIQGYCWLGVLTLSIVLVWLVLQRLARRPGLSAELPVLLLILCCGAFGALSLSGSLLLSQFAVVLGAAVFGCAIIKIVGQIRGGEGLAPVFSFLLIGVLVSGYFFADLPGISAILIASAPAFALVPISKSTPLTFVTRISLVSVPILIALLVAFRSSPPLDY